MKTCSKKILIFVLLAAATNGLKIIKTVTPSCTVETDEGTLDLTSLAGSDSPAFSIVVESTGTTTATLYWNPCNDVTFSKCTESGPGEMFMVTTYSGFPPHVIYCRLVGNKSTSTFKVTDEGKLYLEYAASSSNQFDVRFDCSKAASKNIFMMNTDLSKPKAILFGPGACVSKATPTSSPSGSGGKKALSGGSILLIIALVLIVVYLVAGILFMKFIKKAEGKDLIPNRTFWTDLPVLVKDGILFVVRRGKVSNSSYGNI